MPAADPCSTVPPPARHAVSLPYELRDAREPPICADVGLVPIKTKDVQIWEFCALRRQRVVAAEAGGIDLIACRGGLRSAGPVPADSALHRVAVRGGLEGAEGGFELAGVDHKGRPELVGRLA
jgi:hypothetical protein